MIIDAYQPVTGSGTVHFNIEELTHIIETELAKLGFNRAVILIFDPQKIIIFRYLLAFSDSQFQFYETHIEHAPYEPLALNTAWFGNSIYLQEILPQKEVRNEISMGLMTPTVRGMQYTLSGMYPLSGNHYLMLSAYRKSRPKVREQLLLREFIQFLIHWANACIAQCAKEKQWQNLSSRTNGDTLVQDLTQAEQSVLLMLTQGLDGTEIAQKRHVSKETVRSQIKQLLHKTGSKHQNQLISRYFYNQLRVY